MNSKHFSFKNNLGRNGENFEFYLFTFDTVFVLNKFKLSILEKLY